MKQEKKKTALQQVFDQLKKDGRVTNQADLADKTGFAPVPMSQMLTGKKPVPIRLLESLYEDFGIDTNFLISNGKGEIYRSGKSDMDERVAALEKDNSILKKQLEDKEKIISLMESINPRVVQKETG